MKQGGANYKRSYDVLIRGNLITLWCNGTRLIAIHLKNKEVDLQFYERQGWSYAIATQYPGPADKKEIKTLNSTGEANLALLAAEIQHRLSIKS